MRIKCETWIVTESFWNYQNFLNPYSVGFFVRILSIIGVNFQKSSFTSRRRWQISFTRFWIHWSQRLELPTSILSTSFCTQSGPSQFFCTVDFSGTLWPRPLVTTSILLLHVATAKWKKFVTSRAGSNQFFLSWHPLFHENFPEISSLSRMYKSFLSEKILGQVKPQGGGRRLISLVKSLFPHPSRITTHNSLITYQTSCLNFDPQTLLEVKVY